MYVCAFREGKLQKHQFNNVTINGEGETGSKEGKQKPKWNKNKQMQM